MDRSDSRSNHRGNSDGNSAGLSGLGSHDVSWGLWRSAVRRLRRARRRRRSGDRTSVAEMVGSRLGLDSRSRL